MYIKWKGYLLVFSFLTSVIFAKQYVELSIIDVLGDLDKSTLVSSQEYKELEITLLQKSFGLTQTYAGSWAMYNMCQPINDMQRLFERQQCIEYFLHNESIYQNVVALLTQLCEHENYILGYWNQDLWKKASDKTRQGFLDYVEGFYFNTRYNPFGKFLNNSKLGLECAIGCDFLQKSIIFMVIIGAKSLFTNAIRWAASGSQNDFVWGEAIKDALRSPLAPMNPYRMKTARDKADKRYYLAHVMDYLFNGDSLGDKFYVTKRALEQLHGSSMPLITSSAATLAMMTSAVEAYFLFTNTKNLANSCLSIYVAMQHLHSFMYHVAQYVRIAEKIQKIVTAIPEIQQFMQLHAKVVDNRTIRKEFGCLNQATFDTKHAHFYSRGNVLKAHRQFKKHKKHYIPMIHNMGLIDAIITFVSFVKESMQKGRPICRVRYISSDEPLVMDIKNGWVPLVHTDDVVLNSLCLGNYGPRVRILTGPNGCGKSTILKMMGLSGFWLPFCFGYSCAESVSVSIFDQLCTAMPSQEDISKGLSTYMAELKSMNRIKQEIHIGAQEGKKMMVLIGEPYRGTVEAETARKIMDFGRNIAQFNHYVMGLETHVFKPTTLQQEFPTIFDNGHMRITQYSDGTFDRTYIMDTGAANWWFTDHQKRSLFVDWLEKILLKKQSNAELDI